MSVLSVVRLRAGGVPGTLSSGQIHTHAHVPTKQTHLQRWVCKDVIAQAQTLVFDEPETITQPAVALHFLRKIRYLCFHSTAARVLRARVFRAISAAPVQDSTVSPALDGERKRGEQGVHRQRQLCAGHVSETKQAQRKKKPKAGLQSPGVPHP